MQRGSSLASMVMEDFLRRQYMKWDLKEQENATQVPGERTFQIKKNSMCNVSVMGMSSAGPRSRKEGQYGRSTVNKEGERRGLGLED